jgi:hypothetical protein
MELTRTCRGGKRQKSGFFPIGSTIFRGEIFSTIVYNYEKLNCTNEELYYF